MNKTGNRYYVNIAGFDILQIKGLQSTTLDSLLIADFVNINSKSKTIVDIGSGFGIISMLLAKRSIASIIGVEINEDSYLASLENINKYSLKNVSFLNKDIREYKNIFKEQSVDIVVSNPPYFKENNILNKKKTFALNNARFEDSLSIKDIIKISQYILKNGASLYLVFRTERLIEVISYLNDTNLVIKRLKPVYTKFDDDKSLISLVEIKKNSKQGLILERPIYIYEKDGNTRNEYIEKLYGR